MEKCAWFEVNKAVRNDEEGSLHAKQIGEPCSSCCLPRLNNEDPRDTNGEGIEPYFFGGVRRGGKRTNGVSSNWHQMIITFPCRSPTIPLYRWIVIMTIRLMWNKQQIENAILHLRGYDCNAVWRLKKWSQKGNGMTQRHVGDEISTHVQRPITQRGNCYITRSRRRIAPFPNGVHAGRYHPRWLALRTGGEELQHFAWTIGHEDISQTKKQIQKPIVTCSHTFSRAWHRLHVIFASSSDWFIALFPSVVIGRSDYWYWFYDTQLEPALPSSTQLQFIYRTVYLKGRFTLNRADILHKYYI